MSRTDFWISCQHYASNQSVVFLSLVEFLHRLGHKLLYLFGHLYSAHIKNQQLTCLLVWPLMINTPIIMVVYLIKKKRLHWNHVRKTSSRNIASLSMNCVHLKSSAQDESFNQKSISNDIHFSSESLSLYLSWPYLTLLALSGCLVHCSFFAKVLLSDQKMLMFRRNVITFEEMDMFFDVEYILVLLVPLLILILTLIPSHLPIPLLCSLFLLFIGSIFLLNSEWISSFELLTPFMSNGLILTFSLFAVLFYVQRIQRKPYTDKQISLFLINRQFHTLLSLSVCWFGDLNVPSLKIFLIILSEVQVMFGVMICWMLWKKFKFYFD